MAKSAGSGTDRQTGTLIEHFHKGSQLFRLKKKKKSMILWQRDTSSSSQGGCPFCQWS